MLRTSSYTIRVDLPDNDEQVLLVHGYTGAYDRVSRRVADFLKARDSARGTAGSEPDPEVCSALRRRGYLTHLSVDQERELVQGIVRKLHSVWQQSTPSYVLMPTYDCNLRCPYCFQDDLRTVPAQRDRLRTMEPVVVDRIFKALPKIEELHGFDGTSRKIPGRFFTLFGGEPLLDRSRPTIERILERAREAGEARFAAVTNATQLQAYRDLLGPNGISRLQVTLDGPPSEHDRRRIHADGSGSFQAIAANLDLALEQGVHVIVRMNVDRNNLPRVPELARVLVDRGWHRHPLFTAYVSPIRGETPLAKDSTTLSLGELHQEMKTLRRKYEEVGAFTTGDEPLRRQARAIFSRQSPPHPNLRSSFCGAHTSMYVFDAFGDIYTCWERTAAPNDPELCLGRVQEDGSVRLNELAVRTWRTRTVASNPICLQCRYALLCGGGCATLARSRSGTYLRNYCDGFRSRFKDSVASAFIESQEGDPQDRGTSCGCEI